MSGKHNSSYDSYVGLYVAAAAAIGGAAAIAYLARYSLTEDEVKTKSSIRDGKQTKSVRVIDPNTQSRMWDNDDHNDPILLASNQIKPMGRPRSWDHDPANKKVGVISGYQSEMHPAAQLQIHQFKSRKHQSSSRQLWDKDKYAAALSRPRHAHKRYKQEILPKP